jgi:hypothetical protein
MVHLGRDLDDPVPEPDSLGALARGGQEDLGRGGVAVFLEEVVLDLPDVVEAKPVGELHLLEGILQQAVLGALVLPGTRVLMLVEDAEAHGAAGRPARSHLSAPYTGLRCAG